MVLLFHRPRVCRDLPGRHVKIRKNVGAFPRVVSPVPLSVDDRSSQDGAELVRVESCAPPLRLHEGDLTPSAVPQSVEPERLSHRAAGRVIVALGCGNILCEKILDVSDISIIPTLDKETVRANIKDLLAENIPASKRDYFTTGGTMGKPLGLYTLRDSGWREVAFMQTQWGRAGFDANQLRAILRGSVVHGKRHWTYNPRERAYVFSIFHMTPGQVADYARHM